MEHKNSYIFVYENDDSLSNDKDGTITGIDKVDDKTNDETIVADTGNSIFYRLKRLFPNAVAEKADNEYDRAFRHQYLMETSIRRQSGNYIPIETKIIIHAVKENCYVDITSATKLQHGHALM